MQWESKIHGKYQTQPLKMLKAFSSYLEYKGKECERDAELMITVTELIFAILAIFVSLNIFSSDEQASDTYVCQQAITMDAESEGQFENELEKQIEYKSDGQTEPESNGRLLIKKCIIKFIALVAKNDIILLIIAVTAMLIALLPFVFHVAKLREQAEFFFEYNKVIRQIISIK